MKDQTLEFVSVYVPKAHARPVPSGVIIGGSAAARICLELRGRARAWKSEVLTVHVDFERKIPLGPEKAHAAARVFLLDTVVCAIVIRGVVVRKHIEPDVLTCDASSGTNLVGAVGPRRTADDRRARARRRCSCDDVDGSAGRAPSVEYGPRPAKDLDALDAIQRDRRPADRRELDLIQPLAVQQHEGVLIPGYAEAAQVDLPVRPTGAVPREDPRLLRQQLGQRFRGALPDLLGGDDRHAYRGFEPVFRKTCCGNDDGGFLRTLSKRARRRGRDERGNDGSFQGSLLRRASPPADIRVARGNAMTKRTGFPPPRGISHHRSRPVSGLVGSGVSPSRRLAPTVAG